MYEQVSFLFKAFLRCMEQNGLLNGKDVKSASELLDVAKISIECSEFYVFQTSRPAF